MSHKHIFMAPSWDCLELRAEVATQWSAAYGASLTADNVAITSGCNQAFAAAISAIAQSGDEVLLPAPWYFNHKMWLDMAGVTARAIPTDAQLLPDPEAYPRAHHRAHARDFAGNAKQSCGC